MRLPGPRQVDQPSPLDATKRRNTRYKYRSGAYAPLIEPRMLPVFAIVVLVFIINVFV